MSSTPTISVVLPTHNGSRYIDHSIQSVVEQTLKDWELIIVDDASSDDTPAKIAAWVARDSRISAVRLDRNRKLPGALNEGFRRARGEFLTWTSDDNAYTPDAFELMLGHLREHQNAALVYCDYTVVGPNGEPCGVVSLPEPHDLPRRDTVGACFMYRRAVYEAVGDYAEDMFLVEDYEYWLRVYKRFPISHIAGAAPYKYRAHSGSLTSKRAGDIEIQRARALVRHVVPPGQRRALLAQAHHGAVYHFRHAGEWRRAFRCSAECLRLRPFDLLYWKCMAGTIVRACLARLISLRRPIAAPHAYAGRRQ
jgi:glycosyltransferase involved in cell wall biosynthesis